MPREGAALLSQAEGLLEQFLALGEDYPGASAVSEALNTVRSTMAELRAERGAGEQTPLGEDREIPRGQQFKDFGSARDAAMKDHQKRGGFVDKEPESVEDDEELKKKKKAKAY